MRALPAPPQVDALDHFSRLFPLSEDPKVIELVRKANTEYYHWEQIQRRPLPEGLSAADLWALVKLSRFNRKPVNLMDTRHKPFVYWLPEPATRILHEVDRQGGGTLATVSDAAIFRDMRDRVLVDSLMEEAIATSQIEGAVTTRRVAKEMLRSGRTPKDRSEQMIVNGFATIQLLRDRIQKPLTVDLLHEIQECMTRNTLPESQPSGEFRTTDDVLVVDGRDNEVVFTPPPAADLEGRMQKLVDFANESASSEPFIHPLIRASILHFWLAYEHPYPDGNGRTARALFYWYMLKSGYWLFEFLTISRIIHAAPMRYYRAFLYTEHDENDLTYFLMFQLDVTRRALVDLHQRLGEMAEQQERMLALRLTSKLNSRQRSLLDHALRHPHQIYTFESHQRSQGITYQTARTDLMDLAARSLLTEVGTLRPRQFIPAPDLERRLHKRSRKK